MGKKYNYFNSFLCHYDPKDKEMNKTVNVLYMLDRSSQMFEYEGLPESIPADMLEFILQTTGHCCICSVNGTMYAIFGSLGGAPDPYYRPTLYVVANPGLNYNASLKIGEECVLCRNDKMMVGLLPLYGRYATELVENELSMHIADINARIPKLISAADDRTRASAIEFMKKIECGDLSIIADSQFFEGLKSQDYAAGEGASQLTDLIEYEQYLRSGVWNDIGIPSNYNMKREAINSQEAQLGSEALLPFADDMLHCREHFCEAVNDMFGTDIRVRFSSAWEVIHTEHTEDPEDEEQEVIEDEEQEVTEDETDSD